MKTTKKIIALVLMLSVLFTALSASMSVSASNYGRINSVPVISRYVIKTGESLDLSPYFINNRTNNYYATMNPRNNSVSLSLDEETGNVNAIIADDDAYGINLILVSEYYRHENFNDFLEQYYIIVVVESNEVTAEDMGEIYDFDAMDMKMPYKSASSGVSYSFSSEGLGTVCEYYLIYSDTDKVYIDDEGYIIANETGSFTGTVYVVDAMGHIFSDNFNFEVKYTFGQWLIMIFLFGWLWY